MVPLPSCSCESSRMYQDHMQQQKLLQFLLGLIDSYNQAKSQILMMSPLPTVNQAYSMLIQEENQRGHQGSTLSESSLEPTALKSSIQQPSTALLSNKNLAKHQGNQLSQFNNSKKNWNLQCDNCHLRGHMRESCYKLIGYPADFKFTKKRNPPSFSTANLVQTPSPNSHFVRLSTGHTSSVTHSGSFLFSENKSLHDVLCIPDFKYNLLSVSKLTKNLHCAVTFYPDICVFQVLSNGTMIGIGRESDGLYILKNGDGSFGAAATALSSNSIPCL
ncbi:hypothetical protein CDL12_22326 [Handroanthus impetiginosus]|uniref:Uncharacterized protein n=1 Tax=Handroanthus impetiginosus TaxID=429701 RepID=A0A2G9GIL5_9LAMI|nr:hypothetical protein CDL12_22326 [Handroanthus impetiginosus]